jgi:nucleoside-diphosphate-sugar epimerase
MKIFVAGGSGTIGLPLVRALVTAGNEVTALTRGPSKRDVLRASGASVAIADALDRDALVAALVQARPTHVIHQLTALPKEGPRSRRDLEPTNRLRIDGTRYLLDAAIQAGARRFIVGSFALLAAGDGALDSGDRAAAAVQSMERQVLDATARGAIEAVVLRYGMFYGPEVPSTLGMIDLVRKRRLPVVRGDRGQLPAIHIADAVSATLRALDAAPAGAVYDIVDERPVSFSEIVDAIARYTGAAPPRPVPAWLPRLLAPYMARLTSMRVTLSNRKARAELGWRPIYPTIREGLGQMFQAG